MVCQKLRVSADQVAPHLDEGKSAMITPIVYQQGIVDERALPTLAIVHDLLMLPFVFPHNSHVYLANENRVVNGRLEISSIVPFYIEHEKLLVRQWDDEHRILYEEGVLGRLAWDGSPDGDRFTANPDLPARFVSYPSENLEVVVVPYEGLTLPEQTEEYDIRTCSAEELNRMHSRWERGMPVVFGEYGDVDGVIIRLQDLYHYGRRDVVARRLEFHASQRERRELIKQIQAETVFSYVLPSFDELHPEQILELREVVAETREGFTMHMQRLAKGIEEQIDANTDIADIRRWADTIVATELIPDYWEFKNQLTSEEINIGSKLLDAGGRILTIDSGPTTPAFWGGIVKALGASLGDASRLATEMTTTERQTYEFMALVEDTAKEWH